MPSLKDSLSAFCAQNSIRMNTDLGQHFLIDQNVLDSIIHSANIQSDDTVVEIGPGVGVLTRELVERAKEVTAIELDERFIPLIEKYVGSNLELRGKSLEQTPNPTADRVRSSKLKAHPSNLTLINQNALSVPFPDTPYKIVANIPYHITSPLLRHAFLEGSMPPVSLTLLIQREVAEKICDEHDRSLLTIIVGLFGKPHIVRHVPPDCFLPPPKVDSSVLHIDCFQEPKADAETIEKIFKLTKHAFSQKRKMLRNTMASLPGAVDALKIVGIELTRRPQTLSVDEWVKVAQTMS